MKVSVIVPIYNTSKLLEKCVNSIVRQSISFDNIELILVNDGSTDDSEDVIKKLIKEYPSIKYFYKENGGQGSARNLGLKKATGEFISFVDSDDYIDTNMYEDLYNIAIKDNLDIVTCDYSFVKNSTKKYCSFKFLEDEVNNFLTMNMGPCNMIIRNSFLKEINFSFPTDISYEDIAVIPSLALYTKKIFHLEKSLYNYYIRDDSSMHKKKYSNKLEDIFKAIDILYNKWLELDKEKKHYPEVEYIYIRRLLMSASLRFIEFKDPHHKISDISTVINNKFPDWQHNKYYKVLPLKQRIVAILASKKQRKILYILYKLNSKKE